MRAFQRKAVVVASTNSSATNAFHRASGLDLISPRCTARIPRILRAADSPPGKLYALSAAIDTTVETDSRVAVGVISTFRHTECQPGEERCCQPPPENRRQPRALLVSQGGGRIDLESLPRGHDARQEANAADQSGNAGDDQRI